jgi:DNA modification methylase
MSIELYNADFRELGDLEQRFGEFVIVTDPPFNIGYHYDGYKDNIDAAEYNEMLTTLIMGRQSVIIHYPEYLYELAIESDIKPQRVVSWVYNSNTPRQHRDIAFFNIVPDFTKVRQPYKNPNDKRIKERIARGQTGAKLYDWWNINQVKNTSAEKTEHPCQMPLEVMKRIIGILPDNITVLDPFMGSGTTGAAVAELNGGGSNRSFVGIEIDKNYFNIASKRLYGTKAAQ